MPRYFGPIHGEAVIRTTPSIKDKPFTVYTMDDVHTLARMRGISFTEMYAELEALGSKFEDDDFWGEDDDR